MSSITSPSAESAFVGAFFAPSTLHRRDRRVRDAEALEVGREVGRPIAAAELDDADGLAAAVGVGREVVQLRELRRRERRRAGGGRVRRDHRAGRLLRGRRVVVLELRARRRTIVDAEHAFDDVGQFARHRQLADAAAIGAAGIREVLDVGLERLRELPHGARQEYAATRAIGRDDADAERLREFGHAIEVGLRAAEPLGVVFAPDVLAVRVGVARRRREVERLRAPHAHRHLESLVGRDRSETLRVLQCLAFRAGQLGTG